MGGRDGVCRFFAIGQCSRGSSCRFTHSSVKGLNAAPVETGVEVDTAEEHDRNIQIDDNGGDGSPVRGGWARSDSED